MLGKKNVPRRNCISIRHTEIFLGSIPTILPNMSDVAPEVPGGVTISPPQDPTQKSAKRPNAAKRWCFTWFNYPENWKDLLAPGIQGSKWTAGYEICPETGTPHLQGFVEFPVKVRPIGYKGIPKCINWIKCRGTLADNVKYCSKDGKMAGGNLPWPEELPEIELYGWQLDVEEKVTLPRHNRQIFWYWSREGNRGKSAAVRWLCTKHNALICAGKASDMKYLIVKYVEKHGTWPKTVVFDVPRTMETYLSYSGMEEIKNGVFASTKYECDTVVMPYPHMFVFANFPPDMNNRDMSRDRFVTMNVDAPEDPFDGLPLGAYIV